MGSEMCIRDSFPSLRPLTSVLGSSAPPSAARTCLVAAALSALGRALTMDAVRARLSAVEFHALGWLAGDDDAQVGALAVRKLRARLTKAPFRVPARLPLARTLRLPLPAHLLACVLTGLASRHRDVRRAAKDGAAAYTRQLRATAAAAAVAQRAASSSAGAAAIAAGPGNAAGRRIGLLAEIALPWLVWLVSRDASLIDEDATAKSCVALRAAARRGAPCAMRCVG